MASLKDMRVRIASTKATQKITKAMQMVAASKLRRAQTAAEAARPYAEKMDAVISNIATAAAGSPGAPVLLAGTGKDQVHLLDLVGQLGLDPLVDLPGPCLQLHLPDLLDLARLLGPDHLECLVNLVGPLGLLRGHG